MNQKISATDWRRQQRREAFQDAVIVSTALTYAGMAALAGLELGDLIRQYAPDPVCEVIPACQYR